MNILGLEITRRKKELNSVPTRGWWGTNLFWPVMEPFAGAWQRNVQQDPPENLLQFSAVYACVTGIASDISKMRIKLDRNIDGIWTEITGQSPFKPVLIKPNHYQNRIKFIEQWIVSKLLYGNTYVLKERDQRGIVTRLYILNPRCVRTLVADDGSVFYEIHRDYLSQVPDTITAPASEVIHDMMVSLWHPLVGVPPIYACAVSATMGNKIQSNSTTFFANSSQPGGMLSAPGHIDDETAARLKQYWEANFGGANRGKVAVAGDGLKFEVFSVAAQQSQLAEQLQWTVEDVARAFRYPNYKLGGDLPPYSAGPGVLAQMYLNDCLHPLIEQFEICMDEGLELPPEMGTELDLDTLLRMDTQALYQSNSEMVKGGWGTPDEARFRANYAPVDGGDTPFMQQQNAPIDLLTEFWEKNATAPPKTPTSKPDEPLALPEPKHLDVEDSEFLIDAFLKEVAVHD